MSVAHVLEESAMGYQEHHQKSQSLVTRCAVITLSDTRNESTDKSGGRIKDLLAEQKHTIAFYRVIPDDPALLDRLFAELLLRDDVDVVLTNGGTGISGRDQTIEVVERLLDQPLPGFGELFRMLSYEQIGSGAMLSRAVGGVSRGKLIFAMPGSTKAVELAMSRLILPELKHLISELRKHS
jgi:molybdenum cofactor biosynthesis protein B